MTRVHAVEPPAGIGERLPGAQFVDSYRVTLAGACPDALDAARSILAEPPAWVDGLMALRNLIVAPFGNDLKPGGRAQPGRRG